MEKFKGSKRAIALLCALVLVFSTAMTGCSVKKITKKTPTGSDDSIIIGDGYDEDEPTTIVVGDDGKSYVVDSEGNSVVYTPTSTAVIQGGNNSGVVDTNSTQDVKTTTKGNTANTTTKKSTTPATTKETTTVMSTSDVYNSLAYQRKYGFNKMYDDMARFANFYLDTIRVYFEYDDKFWLIEFWKGEYAMASVGCEIGFYNVNADEQYSLFGKTYRDVYEEKGAESIAYKSVPDEDAMYCSMKLWQYVKSTDAKPVPRINFPRTKCWWAADFENAVLEKHSDRTTLVMVGTVEFPSAAMRDCFTDGLDSKGFKSVASGSITSYDKCDAYAVKGNEVTVGWRYHNDGSQVSDGE